MKQQHVLIVVAVAAAVIAFDYWRRAAGHGPILPFLPYLPTVDKPSPGRSNPPAERA